MKNFRRYLCFIYFFISIHLNNFSSNANPLIGETVSRAGDREFPSVVSLGTIPADHQSNHFCTGTLISKKHVLTCAHCIDVMNETEREWKTLTNVVVTIGSTDVTRGVKYPIANWITFKQWVQDNNISLTGDVNLYHDIAIVTLKLNVEHIKPASLSKLGYREVYDKIVVTAGWGLVTESGEEPKFLHRADVRVIAKEKCTQNLNALNYTQSVINHFCTVGKIKPTTLARGDSGGPVFMNNNQLIGISDVVCAQHCHLNQQNLHLPIKTYRKFIEAIIDPLSRKINNIFYNINRFYD